MEQNRLKTKEKLDKVCSRIYIEPGIVFSLSRMCCVNKGLNDTRIVYNTTLCGLNSVLLAPHFSLLVVQHTFHGLLPSYHQCDMDVREMFLNSPLHPMIFPYAGMDITHVRAENKVHGNRGAELSGNDGLETSWDSLTLHTDLYSCS